MAQVTTGEPGTQPLLLLLNAQKVLLLLLLLLLLPTIMLFQSPASQN